MKKLIIILIFISSISFGQCGYKLVTDLKTGVTWRFALTPDECLQRQKDSIDAIATKLKAKADSIKASWGISLQRRKDSLSSALNYVYSQLNSDANYGTFVSTASWLTAKQAYESGNKSVLLNWINNTFTSANFPNVYSLARKNKLLSILNF